MWDIWQNECEDCSLACISISASIQVASEEASIDVKTTFAGSRPCIVIFFCLMHMLHLHKELFKLCGYILLNKSLYSKISVRTSYQEQLENGC
jgi:hypothetical protein